MRKRTRIGWVLLGTYLILSLSACGASKKADGPDPQLLQKFIDAKGPGGAASQQNPAQPGRAGPTSSNPQGAAGTPAANPAGTGSLTRSYPFPDTNKTIPYRVYVPSTWNASQKLPMVVLLHGRGEDENSLFDKGPDTTKGIVAKMAEQYNFIIVAPLGYSKNGGFGAEESKTQKGPGGANSAQSGTGSSGSSSGGQGGPGGGAPPDGGQGGPGGGTPPDGGQGGPGDGSPPDGGQGGSGGGQTAQGTPAAGDSAQSAGTTQEADNLNEQEKTNLNTYSEQDVLNVVSLVTQEFNVDTTKVFLTGTGMGGDGTMHLATKYPDLWLAIAPTNGGFDLTTYEALIPVMKVKGALLVNSSGGQSQPGQGAGDQTSNAQAPAGQAPGGSDTMGSKAQSPDEIAEKLKALGVDTRIVTAENTRSSEAWYTVADQIFAFFDTFAKQ